MKEQKHIWEADVRQKVLGHEFEYDSNDWGAMSDLLDKAGTLPPPSLPGPSSDFGISGSWKSGFIAILIVGFIAFLYVTKDQSFIAREQAPVETNAFPLESEEKKQERPSADSEEIENAKRVSPVLQNETQHSSRLTDQKRSVFIKEKKSEFEYDTTAEAVRKTADTKEVTPTEREKIFNITLLPNTQVIPLLEIPERSLDLKIQTLPPKLPKRKRDPKKLYPDVIDNY